MSPPAQTISADYRCDMQDRQLADHEARIRSLERASWRVAGAAGMLAFLGSVLAKLIPWGG